MFRWNVLLALAWALLRGEISMANIAVGLALGYAILSLMSTTEVAGSTQYSHKVSRALRMAAFFTRELVKANLRVAYDVLTPRYYMHPGIVAIPLDARTDAEITLLAALITLTPGSLALDVSDDRTVMYIHVLYMSDVETVRRTIKQGLERHVLELLR